MHQQLRITKTKKDINQRLTPLQYHYFQFLVSFKSFEASLRTSQAPQTYISDIIQTSVIHSRKQTKMVVIKLQLAEDIRRLSVPESFTFEDLSKLAVNSFGKKLPSNYVFKYKDEEDDLVTISSEPELQEALQSNESLLKITISSQEYEEEEEEEEEEEGSDEEEEDIFDTISNIAQRLDQERKQNILHPAVCDGCNVGRIRGNRYKCKFLIIVKSPC